MQLLICPGLVVGVHVKPFCMVGTHPAARQPPEVWRAFKNLYLPTWDLDFVKRVLWGKLPVGVRQERMGGQLCLLDGRVENHEHVLCCGIVNFRQPYLPRFERRLD